VVSVLYGLQNLRQDPDSGIFYKIDSEKGSQRLCDPAGNLILPFDPRITGKYDYKGRTERIAQTGAELSAVELPHSIKISDKRNYVP